MTNSPPDQPARITSQTNALALATYVGVIVIGAGALAGKSTATDYLTGLFAFWGVGTLGIGIWGVLLAGSGGIGLLSCVGAAAWYWKLIKRRELGAREVVGTKVVALVYEGIAAAVAGGCCALLQGAIIMSDGFVVSTPAVVALGGAARLVQVVAEVRRITRRAPSE